MIDHTGIDVSDYARSRAFYEALLAPLGFRVRKEMGTACGFGDAAADGEGDPHGEFWIMQGTPMTPRRHIAFRASSPEQVRVFHRAGLAAGGVDNGGPGLRPQYHARYYAAFVLDPDGYNVEAVFHGGAD